MNSRLARHMRLAARKKAAGQFKPQVDQVGSFWIVADPTKEGWTNATLADVCYQVNLGSLYNQILGGLRLEVIAGVYSNENKAQAEQHALRLINGMNHPIETKQTAAATKKADYDDDYYDYEPPFPRNGIECANCGGWCGTSHPATRTDPGYAEGPGEDFSTEDGEWCCSQECLDELMEKRAPGCEEHNCGKKPTEKCSYCEEPFCAAHLGACPQCGKKFCQYCLPAEEHSCTGAAPVAAPTASHMPGPIRNDLKSKGCPTCNGDGHVYQKADGTTSPSNPGQGAKRIVCPACKGMAFTSAEKTADFGDEPEELPAEDSDTVQKARAIAEKAGYQWQGLYNEDEDGKVYRLSKGNELLYLTEPVGDPSREAWHGETPAFEWYEEPGASHGNDLASLQNFVAPPDPEENETWEQSQKRYDEEDTQEWVTKMTKFLKGRGESGFGEAIHEGATVEGNGYDAGVDYIIDKLIDARCPDRIQQAVVTKLKEIFADTLNYEAEEVAPPADVPITFLTPEEITQVKEAAERAWDGMARDTFNNARLFDGTTSYSGKRVTELVLDANHIESLGGLSSELYQKLLNAPRDQRDSLFNKIFPWNQWFSE